MFFIIAVRESVSFVTRGIPFPKFGCIVHPTHYLHAPISKEKLARDVYPKSVIRSL